LEAVMGKKIILNISLIIIILSLNIVYADAVYPDYRGADASFIIPMVVWLTILFVIGLRTLFKIQKSNSNNYEEKNNKDSIDKK